MAKNRKDKKQNKLEVKNTEISGWFAEWDKADPRYKITKIGYEKKGNVSSGREILVPKKELVNIYESELSAFLRTIYDSGAHISKDAKPLSPGVHEILTRQNLISEYESIKVLDFMSLLGAIGPGFNIVPYIKTKDEKTPPERPTVYDTLKMHPGDNRLMFTVIKYLGLKGYFQYIFAEHGITFAEMYDLWFYFYPEQEEREKAYPGLNVFIRKKGIILNHEESNALLSGWSKASRNISDFSTRGNSATDQAKTEDEQPTGDTNNDNDIIDIDIPIKLV